MSPEDRERFSKVLGSVPAQLCSGESSPFRRPRLYWINWPLGAVTPELSWEAQPGVIKATLRGGHPSWADELERGARRPCGEDGPWAAIVRSIPRERPPSSPAGLSTLDQAGLERWERDPYIFPPYQYRRDNLVEEGKTSRLCPLACRESACRPGLHWNQYQWAVHLSESRGRRLVEDARRSLLDISFSVPVVGSLLWRGLFAGGLQTLPPTIAECWGEPGPEARDYLKGLLGVTPEQASPQQVHAAVCESMVRSAIFKGSDVRVATGTMCDPADWPRSGVPADRWQWRICLSFPPSGAHINVLELKALIATVRRRMRARPNIGARFIHFCDSQVCIAAACKGRSSSNKLQRQLMRLNALLLSTSSHPFWVYVWVYIRSELNPADEPSKWW